MKKKELIEACTTHRATIETRSLATADEVERYWPEAGVRAPMSKWIYCYAQYTRLVGRMEFVTPGKPYAVEQTLKAQQAEPIEISLQSGEVVKVYPKSFHALRWIEKQSFWIQWLGVRLTAMEEAMVDYEELSKGGNSPLGTMRQPGTVHARTVDEIDHRTVLICWAACHEGAGLPWAAGTEEPPLYAVPAVYRDLSPFDITRLHAAIVEVNMSRLQYLPRPQEMGKGITPDLFFASQKKTTGRDIRELMMDVSLAEQIAQVALQNHRPDEPKTPKGKGR